VMKDQLNRMSLSDQVSDLLRKYVEEHQLKPGDHLPTETELAELFGVSRTVVREGLSALSALDLVESGNGRRATIRSMSATPLKNYFSAAVHINGHIVSELLGIRQALETYSAGLAAEHHRPEHIVALTNHLQSMEKALRKLDGEAFVDADMEFHRVIAVSSGNRTLLFLIEALGSATRKSMTYGLGAWQSTSNVLRIHQLHEEICRAIASRDAELASSAMQRHFSEAIGTLVSNESSGSR